jgi:hypothetical protein
MNDKVIEWSGPLFLVEDMDKHFVTNININPLNSMVDVYIQNAFDVQKHSFSMKHAQEIGFININALLKYCK